MMSFKVAGIAVLAVAAFAGCGGGDTSTNTGQASQSVAVPSPSSSCTPLGSGCWEDYDPQVQARIDKAIASGNCAKLQDEFDQAEANNAATMERLGHNNADLMTYIDEGLQQAGCYD